MRVSTRDAAFCLALLSVPIAPHARAQDLASPPIEDRIRAVECLTLAIAYEAGNEGTVGQQAVAEVVLNRMRSRAFPKTVCDVVFAGATRRTGCQFTFTCDGSLYRRRPSQATMEAARIVAEDTLDSRVAPVVPGATHYHADYVHPYWAPSLVRIAKIGTHIFYQPGSGGVAASPGAIPAILPVAAGGDRAAAGTGPASGLSAVPVFAPWGLAPAPAAPTASGGQ